MIFDREAGRMFLLNLQKMFRCRRLNYFLTNSTALGAVREEAFVPNETEINVGLPIEELIEEGQTYSTVLTESGFTVREISEPFGFVHRMVVTKQTKPKNEETGEKTRITANIVGWHYCLFDGAAVRFAHCIPCSGKTDYAVVHPAGMIDNTIGVKMFGHWFPVPNPPKLYLAREYGAEWTEPHANSLVSRARVYNFFQEAGLTTDWFYKGKG